MMMNYKIICIKKNITIEDLLEILVNIALTHYSKTVNESLFNLNSSDLKYCFTVLLSLKVYWKNEKSEKAREL